MLALLKQQQTSRPLNIVHHPPTSAASYQPPITITILDNDLVAISQQQQQQRQSPYLGPNSQHPRLYCGYHIPISGEHFLCFYACACACIYMYVFHILKISGLNISKMRVREGTLPWAISFFLLLYF